MVSLSVLNAVYWCLLLTRNTTVLMLMSHLFRFFLFQYDTQGGTEARTNKHTRTNNLPYNKIRSNLLIHNMHIDDSSINGIKTPNNNFPMVCFQSFRFGYFFAIRQCCRFVRVGRSCRCALRQLLNYHHYQYW